MSNCKLNLLDLKIAYSLAGNQGHAPDVRALIDVYETLQAQLATLQWVKVSEKLPENMDTVLVIENGNNPKQGYYGHKERQWYIWVNAWCLTSKITHWKPITLPDKEKSNE